MPPEDASVLLKRKLNRKDPKDLEERILCNLIFAVFGVLVVHFFGSARFSDGLLLIQGAGYFPESNLGRRNQRNCHSNHLTVEGHGGRPSYSQSGPSPSQHPR